MSDVRCVYDLPCYAHAVTVGWRKIGAKPIDFTAPCERLLTHAVHAVGSGNHLDVVGTTHGVARLHAAYRTRKTFAAYHLVTCYVDMLARAALECTPDLARVVRSRECFDMISDPPDIPYALADDDQIFAYGITMAKYIARGMYCAEFFDREFVGAYTAYCIRVVMMYSGHIGPTETLVALFNMWNCHQGDTTSTQLSCPPEECVVIACVFAHFAPVARDIIRKLHASFARDDCPGWLRKTAELTRNGASCLPTATAIARVGYQFAHPNLSTITIAAGYLNAARMETFATMLCNCSALRELQIYDNAIGDEGAVALARALQHCTTLTRLSLPACRIGADGCRAIAAALSHCSTLRSLDVSRNDRGDIIAAATTACPLEMLNVARNHIPGDAFAGLFDALANHSTLRSLVIHAVPHVPVAARHIAAAMTHWPALTSYIATGILIGDAGAQEIAATLPRCTALMRLDMRSNGIGDAGVQAIAAAIPQCQGLVTLILTGNTFADPGIAALYNAVTTGGAATYYLDYTHRTDGHAADIPLGSATEALQRDMIGRPVNINCDLQTWGTAAANKAFTVLCKCAYVSPGYVAQVIQSVVTAEPVHARRALGYLRDPQVMNAAARRPYWRRLWLIAVARITAHIAVSQEIAYVLEHWLPAALLVPASADIDNGNDDAQREVDIASAERPPKRVCAGSSHVLQCLAANPGAALGVAVLPFDTDTVAAVLRGEVTQDENAIVVAAFLGMPAILDAAVDAHIAGNTITLRPP